VSGVHPVVGRATYRLLAVVLGLGARGTAYLSKHSRLLRRAPEQTAPIIFRAKPVSELSRLARFRTRFWLARSHVWQTQWAGFDWYVTAEAGQRRVSIAGVVDREGSVGGVPARLGLLGGVLTVPSYRRRGLGGEVVDRATGLMRDTLGCDYGVLICGEALIPFYERRGWRQVSNPMIYERFGRRRIMKTPVMVYECGGHPLPPGPIDVHGLPA
jgi:GNAT superfamily N-acetyltransferase